ncbi:MAG: type II secretion system protein [Mobilitalea sp.]
MQEKMVKQNNKGFSLVELIIVMAILAILVGAIAPQVFTYVEDSRRSKDLQIVNTVFTAVQTAIASKTTAPAAISNETLDVVIGSTILPKVADLLADDMDSVAEIKTKAVSKFGQAGTLYVNYNDTTGKLQVYIGSAAGTTNATLPVVTN